MSGVLVTLHWKASNNRIGLKVVKWTILAGMLKCRTFLLSHADLLSLGCDMLKDMEFVLMFGLSSVLKARAFHRLNGVDRGG